ncbi:MAG: helix-turn-helix domain-containing protein [Polyangiales bacterium]|nr:TetR/AcrR family transcriptional regulator [Sandaracinaceae bacterium]
MIDDRLSFMSAIDKGVPDDDVQTHEKPDGRRTDTRARLLDEALRLLLAEGYEAATTGRIAKRAGIRQSSFYSHFASREACLAEAATREAELLVQRLGSRRRALRDAPMALRRSREAAVAGLEMALAHLATHDELRALIAMRHAEHAAGDAVRAALARLRDGLVKDLDVFGVVAPRDATMRVELMMALTSEAADGVHEGRYTLDAVVPVLMDQVGALFPRSDTP